MEISSSSWMAVATLLWVPKGRKPEDEDFSINPNRYECDVFESLEKAIGFLSSHDPYEHVIRQDKAPWLKTFELGTLTPDAISDSIETRVEAMRREGDKHG